MRRRISMLIFLMIAPFVLAQESPFEQIKQLYENFEYDKVIQKSESVVVDPLIGDSTKIEIYLMRAGSYYYYNNIDQVKINFEKILLLRKDYSPNTAQYLNSTLIGIFNGIKAEHLKRLRDVEIKKDSTAQLFRFIYDRQISFGKSFVKNIFLPGWGQMSMGHNRGILYSLSYLISLGAWIYYVDDTNQKESAYQKETQETKFDILYSEYNKSYRTKNILLVSWIAVSVLSQLDLLLFHQEDAQYTVPTISNSLNKANTFSEINFSLRVPIQF